jgi:cytochrome c oxidase subunit 2
MDPNSTKKQVVFSIEMNIRKLAILTLVTGALALVLVACGLPFWTVIEQENTNQPSGSNSSIRNGERIYFTSTSNRGDSITYQGGPAFGGMMMGSYLTCAACHGPEGHGGVHMMHMQLMEAPDITYNALNDMMEEETGGTMQPGGYSLEDFRKSVVLGEHPDGDELDPNMPRWQMSDADLKDLFAFIKSLSN